ncbi:MAG: glycosyltransferase, partial [Armatimonadota bacterium]|nr:glycosyltransferase [Armatimonadota bacterium]
MKGPAVGPLASDPCKVVHLITALDVGGAELALARLLPGLRDRGIHNTVVSLTAPGRVALRIREAGVAVRSLGLRRGSVAPGAVFRLRRLLQAERPDILQTWMYHADLLGAVASWRRVRPALLWNVRASDVEMTRYGWLSAATRRTCAWLSRRPLAVVANSQAGIEFHQRLGYRPARWVMIPNGVDSREFRPDPVARASFRAELGIPGDAKLVGLVGRRDPMKGHDVFLEAARALMDRWPSLHVLLAGPGVEADVEPFASWSRALEPTVRQRVHLLGPRDDMPRLYAALDVACSASLFGEGFPNVIAEAMATGVPVVATAVGDAPHLVGDTGFIVPPGDAASLADRCGMLVGDDGRRRAMGEAARRRIVSLFGMDRVADAYARLYTELALAHAVPAGVRG